MTESEVTKREQMVWLPVAQNVFFVGAKMAYRKLFRFVQKARSKQLIKFAF